MQQIVIIVEIKGDDALVRSDQGGCQGCEAKSSCAALGGQQKATFMLSVSNRLMAKVGDRVVLEMDDRAMLRATWWLYGMPMLAFIGSGVLMHALATMMQWSSVDLWAVSGACIGMAMMWRVSSYVDQKPEVQMLRFDSGEICLVQE
ncbi:MAG: SoxR reducing system RseC family protein [Mariprofundaceae bacterium]|nr:SoxR reducing system RseC family protein [Mariprofundaceae bacterium]